MKPKLIVFDLNKTLIQENSWLDLNLAMGVTQEEDDMLMAWAEQGVINDVMGQNILCNIYKKRGDVSRKNILDITKTYKYLPGAKEVVAELIHKGYTLALISGAINLLVQHVAKELGFKYWLAANKFIFDKNNNLERIDAPLRDESAKLEMLEELCNQLSINITDCLVVGDGANDIALFNKTGNGVTFIGSNISHKAKYLITNLRDLLSLVK